MAKFSFSSPSSATKHLDPVGDAAGASVRSAPVHKAPPKPAPSNPAPKYAAPPNASAPRTFITPRPVSPDGSVPLAAAPGATPAKPSTGGFSFGPSNQASLIPQVVQLRGTLDELKIFGQWGKAKLVTSSGQRINVTGNALKDLQVGSNYMLEGIKSEHEKFGTQFDILRAEPDVQSTDSLIKHIVRNFKGAGELTARKMVEHHESTGTLEAFTEALIHSPASVDFKPFTNREVTLNDDEDSTRRRLGDSLSIRFGSKGLGQAAITPLSQYLLTLANATAARSKSVQDLVSLANKIFDDDPYRPVGQIQRYGFLTADVVGRSLGVASLDPRRLAAVVIYALKKCCEDQGHIWVPQRSLVEEIRRMDPKIDALLAIRLAIEQGQPIVIENKGAETRFYSGDLRHAETTLAECLSRRLTKEVEPLMPYTGQELEELIDRAVQRTAKHKGVADFALDESQRSALRGILSSTCSLHTLTGGPGCGKTAIVEVLMDALSESELPLPTTFCAPIGKAAKVLNERIKNWGQAKTIHATLEFTDSFGRHSGNPLDTSFVVTDEQSMLGGPLGMALFDAIPLDTHILMLGDPDQLAPIEPGRVLKSVLDIKGMDHHRLTTTHRNSGEILDLIRSVGAGKCLTQSRGPVNFMGSLPEPTAEVFTKLAAEVVDAGKRLGGIERVGVICPVRKGSPSQPGWNVTYLNSVLRDVINPDEDGSKKIIGTPFRLKDRIILTQNDNLELIEPDTIAANPSVTKYRSAHEILCSIASDSKGANVKSNKAARARGESEVYKDVPDPWEIDDHGAPPPAQGHDEPEHAYVVNGDTGWIESVQYHEVEDTRTVKFMILRLDDGRHVKLPHAKLEALSLSYAITVHAAQGSEYAKVFGIVVDGNEQFMHRAMLFTMFSRAKEELTVIGDPQVIQKVSARAAPVRNCALTERAIEQAAQLVSEQEQSHNQRRRPSYGQAA